MMVLPTMDKACCPTQLRWHIRNLEVAPVAASCPFETLQRIIGGASWMQGKDNAITATFSAYVEPEKQKTREARRITCEN